MLTGEDVRTWLKHEVRLDMSQVDDDTPLFSSGRLDSFTMVELVALIEERTGKVMAALEVTHENIDTINRVLAWTRGEEVVT